MPEQVQFEELSAASGRRIGVATLDVPKTLNSLTLAMVEGLLGRLAQWQDDDAIAAVVLRGAGEKAFCAGGDVQALHASATESPGGPCVYAETFFEREYRLDYLIHRFRKPVLCWGHGIVMGGGLGLFAACSHRIVTERTRVAMPEITIALYPDVGGSWFLNRMPGRTGMYVALTAAALNAADMQSTGLATHYLHSSQQQALTDALCAADWQTPDAGTTVARVLASLGDQTECGVEGNIEPQRRLIEKLCTGDNLERVVQQILADTTQNPWLEKNRAALAAGSPIAAHTIWEQLKRSRDMSLEEVFRFELMLSTNVVRYPEFAEGVRALLIDKDRTPAWRFADVSAVPRELIDSLFTPPWPENPLADLGVS